MPSLDLACRCMGRSGDCPCEDENFRPVPATQEDGLCDDCRHAGNRSCGEISDSEFYLNKYGEDFTLRPTAEKENSTRA